MPVSELLPLYAPFVGLLGVTFWLGVLSARVGVLEREMKERKAREVSDRDDRDRIVRLETKVDDLSVKMDQTQRELATVHRLLANAASGRGNRSLCITEEGEA